MEEKRFTSLFAMSTRTRSEQKRRVAACLRVCVCARARAFVRSSHQTDDQPPFSPDIGQSVSCASNAFQTPTTTYKPLIGTYYVLQTPTRHLLRPTNTYQIPATPYNRGAPAPVARMQRHALLACSPLIPDRGSRA